VTSLLFLVARLRYLRGPAVLPAKTGEESAGLAILDMKKPMKGTGCMNWKQLIIGHVMDASDAGACSVRCNSNADCAYFNFKARDGCGDQEILSSVCVILKDGCVPEERPCMDLYPRMPAEAAEKSVHVFKMVQTLGIGCFRIPAMVRTPTGRLLAFAEARHSEPYFCQDVDAQEIITAFSDDFGLTWSEPKFAMGSAESRVGNPYPIVLRSGKIVLVYAKHDSGWDGHVASGIGVVTSEDDGETWSDEADFSEHFAWAASGLPGPGAGVSLQLPDGRERLLVVSHVGKDVTSTEWGFSYTEFETADYITYSDDGGTSWTTLKRGFPHMDEGSLADLGGGEVMLVMRYAEMAAHGRAVVRSLDYGMTWSEDVEFSLELPHIKSQGSLLHHRNATYFSGPMFEPDPYRRQMITVRKSLDKGMSWEGNALVKIKPGPGYSSMVGGDGLTEPDVGVLFEADEGIFFAPVTF
jgi:sialidase-1